MHTIRAFILGMWEFRRDFTTHFDGSQINTYDRARDLAHRLTLRRYDDDFERNGR